MQRGITQPAEYMHTTTEPPHQQTPVGTILCRQVFDRRVHGWELREGAGRWLAEERADEGGGNGRLVGDVVRCFLRVHVVVHNRARKVRASNGCRKLI